MKSRVVALSAISAAFIALFLTLGAYIEFIDIISVIIASVFTLLPMYYKSRTGSFLAFLAGGLIAFLISGANIYSLVFPAYFAFFGLLPILNAIVKESGKIGKKLWLVIKLVWFLAVMFALLYYYTGIMGIPLEYTFSIFGQSIDLSGYQNIYYYFLLAYGLISVVIFFVYDKFSTVAQVCVDKFLVRIIKK